MKAKHTHVGDNVSLRNICIVDYVYVNVIGLTLPAGIFPAQLIIVGTLLEQEHSIKIIYTLINLM